MPEKKSDTTEKVVVGATAIAGLWLFLFVLLPITLLIIFLGVSCAAGV